MKGIVVQQIGNICSMFTFKMGNQGIPAALLKSVVRGFKGQEY